MLYDRDYMRSGDGPNFRSPVLLLLIALSSLFLLECVLKVHFHRSMGEWFGLTLAGVREHQYYRLLTYQFLHDAPWPWHLLMNGIGLWFIGRSVLEVHGTKRFWALYLAAGLVGGVADLFWQLLFPGGWTIGASANVMGLLAAFCLQNPGRDVVFFLYVIPVRMRAMTMFWLFFGFSIFGLLFRLGDIAHAAHLGGMLAGAAFARWTTQDGVPDWLRRLRRRPEREAEVPVAAGHSSFGGSKPISPQGISESISPEEYMRREVDPILDKILAHGQQSLTEKERRILEQAPKRLRGK